LRFVVQKLDPTVALFTRVRDQEKRSLRVLDVINAKAVRLFRLVVGWLGNTVDKRNKSLGLFVLNKAMSRREIIEKLPIQHVTLYLPVIVVREIQQLIAAHDTPSLSPATHDCSLFRQPALFLRLGLGVSDNFLIWKVISNLCGAPDIVNNINVQLFSPS
jgi:hypothetical protein